MISERPLLCFVVLVGVATSGPSVASGGVYGSTMRSQSLRGAAFTLSCNIRISNAKIKDDVQSCITPNFRVPTQAVLVHNVILFKSLPVSVFSLTIAEVPSLVISIL